MKLKLNKTLLTQRELLQQLSQLSYTYSKLNENYQGGDLTNEEAEELIVVYSDLLKKVIRLAKEIENESELYGKEK